MAKYQKYAEYKDSGVKELGSIPIDWNVSRIKYLTKCLDGQRIPLNGVERGDKKGNIPYWGANKIVDFIDDWLFDEELILLGEDGAPFFDKLKDVAFAVNGKIWPNNHVHVLRPFKKLVNTKFLTYALNCTDYSLYISGSTRDKLNQSDMDNILIRLPSLNEQTQIANFLDHETAKIDSLIAKQEKLIELLKEKRQAVISHAVTKGLNPDVTMKDSGVEWLGQVPEHWEILKFDYAINTVSDIDHYMPSSVDVGIPYIMTGDLKDFVSDIDFESCKQVAYSDYQKLSRKIKTTKDDIIFARYATIGTLSYVDIDKEFLVSYSCVTIKSNSNRTTGKYLSYYLKSQAFLQAIQQQINSNTQGNVGVDSLRNVKIILPLLSEQENIIEFLQAELIKMDNLINKAESAIQLMQERRTALISSAVTGKIDVRNWQHPNEAKTGLSQ